MAIHDVTEAFDDEWVSAQLTTYSVGTYEDGTWVSAQNDPVDIDIVVHPASDSERAQLFPEGNRDKMLMKFWTKVKVKTVDKKAGTEADIISISGDDFKVISVKDWSQIGGYYKSFGERI